MADLMAFLEKKDLGITRNGHTLHISHAVAESMVTAAEMFHVAAPTMVGAAGGSTIGLATVAGVAAAYAGPVLGLAGTFMALGSGYEEAREEIRNEATASGFSQGFVAGILNMSVGTVRHLFGKHGVIHSNAMDPESDTLKTRAYNRGLVAGYVMANTAGPEQRKAFVFEIRRKMRGGDVPHDVWDDLQKRNYVIEYAAKLRLHFLSNIE